MAVDGETVSEIVPCIFKGLSATKKQRYSVKMGGGYSEVYTEEFLQSVLYQTDQHLVVRTKDGRKGILFHSRQLGVYDDVTYLSDNVFIAKNEAKMYGLIRCRTVTVEIIRPFQYVNIELSNDKRNILLYKSGRPRFIPLKSVVS